MACKSEEGAGYICLFGEPTDIPSAEPLHIPYHQLKAREVKNRHSIETNVEKDLGPLEERVFCISCPH